MLDISNQADRLDSREIIGEIDSLEFDLAEDDLDSEGFRELKILLVLAEQGRDYAEDWEYGATLVRFDNFTEYAREFMGEAYGRELENMPKILRDAIDWEIVAESMMDDYTEIDYDGVTYYVRTKQD